MIIHCREAAADLIPLVEAAAVGGRCVAVLHAFSGDAAMAAKCVELGLMISFAGNVTYTNKKFEPLRAAAAAIPADRILLGDRLSLLNARAFSRQAATQRAGDGRAYRDCVAQGRGVSVEQLVAETTANARRVFGF